MPLTRPIAQSAREACRCVFALGVCSSLLVSASALSGCARSQPGPVSARPPTTSDGLVVARKERRSILWVKPDHHLGRYDAVLVNVAGFRYADSQKPLDRGQERQIREMLRGAFSGYTGSGPVRVAARSGPCVVTLEVGLKDLRLHTEDFVGSSSSYVSSFGSTTMLIEFRDSLTNTPLLRFMANRSLGSGPGTGQAGADLNRLGATLSSIVTNMIDDLQTVVPTTTGTLEHECQNGILKRTGRQ